MSSESSVMRSTSLLDHTDIGDNIIAVPIHLVHLNDEGAQHSPQSMSPCYSFGKEVEDQNFIIGKQNNSINNESQQLLTSSLDGFVIKCEDGDGIKNFLMGSSSIIDTTYNERELIDENPLPPDNNEAISNLDERQEILLELQNDPGNNELIKPEPNNDLDQSNNIFLDANDLNGKYFDGKQFTIAIADGQLVLTPSDAANFETSVVLDQNELNNSTTNLLPGQFMVTKLLKNDNSSLGEKIPDSQTITIDRSGISISAAAIDDDEPIGSGPWNCKKCHVVFEKWSQFKKHEKKHFAEKPFQCNFCAESFNIEKNLTLHMSLHSEDGHVCPECGKSFKRLASFKAHITLHEEEEIVNCSNCNEEFFSINQLNSHKCKDPLHSMEVKENAIISPSNIKVEPVDEEVTRTPPTYTCKKCGAIFNSSIRLKNHNIDHKRMKKLIASRPRRKFTDRSMFEQKCSVCNKAFSKPSQLTRHMRIHTGEKPFKCTYPGCDKAFNQKGTMQIHLGIHMGTRTHKCEFCGRTFIQKSNLRGHMKRVHPLYHGNEQRFQCDECPCVFKRANSLNAHISRAHVAETFLSADSDDLEVHSLMKQLQDLEKRRKSESDYGTGSSISTISDKENKIQVKDQSLNASETDVTKNTDNTVDSDILQEALKNSGLTQPKDHAGHKWRLDKIPNGATGKFHKIKLMTVVDRVGEGNVKRYPVLVRIQGDIKWHMCAFENCDKKFKKPSDLVRHIRVHTHERPYKCSICPRAFSIKATLDGHMITHSNERKFSCDKCPKKFPTQVSLKNHIMHHRGIKPYQCTKCPKVFRTVSQQKAHLLSHSQSPHTAHELKKKTMILPDVPLQEPILLTSKGPVKMVSRYNDVYILDGIENSERPHKCKYCAAAFKKSSHAKQHERTHTGERPYKCDFCMKYFSSASILKSHIKTHEGLRPHRCNRCNKNFTSSGSLNRHRATHSENRPFICPYCRKAFKTNSNCKKHIKTHKHELAMNAVRAAESNLQNSSETSLLSSSLYNNHHTASANKILLSLNEDMNDRDYQTKGDPTIHSEEPEKTTVDITPTFEPASDSIIEESHCMDSEASEHIETSFTHDLDGGLTLSSLQKDAKFNSNEIDLIPSSGSGTSLLFSNNSLLSNAKLMMPSNSQSSNQQDSMNADAKKDKYFYSFVVQPGTIFGVEDYVVRSTTAHKLDDQTVELSIQDSDTQISQFMSSVSDANSKKTLVSLHDNLEGKSYINNLQNCGDSLKDKDNNCTITTNETSIQLGELQLNEEASTNIDVIEGEFNESEEINDSKSKRKRKKLVREGFEELLESCPIKVQRLLEENNGKENNLSQDLSNKFQCTICKRGFNTVGSFRAHMRFHRSPRSRPCKQCGSLINVKSLREHNREQHFLKNCKLCQESFCGEERLFTHIKEAHRELAKEGQEKLLIDTYEKSIWHCPVCKTYFNSSEAIQKHLTKHSSEEISETLSSYKVPSNDNKLKISNMEALFQESGTYQEDRLEINQPPKARKGVDSGLPYVCNVCEKGFKKPSDLVRHNRTHTGEKPYACKLCMKRFAVKSTLLVHMRTHTGKKEFPCQLCNALYSSKGSLKIHMRLHTGVKPLKCQYCGLKFRTSSHRKAHIIKHFKVNGLALKNIEIKKAIEQPLTLEESPSIEDVENESSGGGINKLEAITDVNDEPYQLMINPDHTVTIPNLPLIGLDSSASNLQAVTIEDNLISDLQLCNPVTLELSGENADDAGENSLSVDPNSVMTHQRGMPMSNKSKPLGKSYNINSQAFVSNADSVATSVASSLSSQVIPLCDLVLNNSSNDNPYQCMHCSDTFSKFTDLQAHSVEHGFFVGGTEELPVVKIIESSVSDSDMAINLKKTDYSSKSILQKIKQSIPCSFEDCRYIVYNERDLHRHLEMDHNVGYQCHQCKEILPSYTQLQRHLDSECSSKITGFSKSNSIQGISDRLSYSSSANSSMLGRANDKDCEVLDYSRCLPETSQEGIDEDFDHLMMKDIFLPQ